MPCLLEPGDWILTVARLSRPCSYNEDLIKHPGSSFSSSTLLVISLVFLVHDSFLTVPSLETGVTYQR